MQTYTVHFHPQPGGGYTVTVPALPGCITVTECADNQYNDWIGAQIRADLYGWVCPDRPTLAADLARRDAALSHRLARTHAGTADGPRVIRERYAALVDRTYTVVERMTREPSGAPC